jgi:pilus assembly protein CpaF
MSEQEHNDVFPSVDRRPRLDADKGREPELVSARLGTRQVSQAALVERVVAAFHNEYNLRNVLQEVTTRSARLGLLRPTVDYVLAVESVVLSSEALARLLREAYSQIFGFGPLDALLADERITTIALEGPERVSVRYGHGDLTSVGALFDDAHHLRETLARMLAAAGAELREDVPIIETGLRAEGRPVALSIALPPASLTLNADIRLHPRTPPSLGSLVQDGVIGEDAAHFLASVVASPYGLVVVGESETGKTSLLGALAARLPVDSRIIAVERSGELQLSEAVACRSVRWPVGDLEPVSFGDQVRAALQTSPDTLLLDEVRADDPAAIAPLLLESAVPRQLWTYRGAPDAKRLQASLGMLARRACGSEVAVHALYDRLPFVVSMVRVQGQLRVFSIGEWQPTTLSDYADYVLLYQYRDGAARPTDRQQVRPVAMG